jgi:PucR family transcriptional regulator, purine catabolism regulatory protein
MMKNLYYHSVESILSRKYFEHSRVIAGQNGLQRQVKWVHVVEVTSIKNLLNGHELILTTGLALKEETAFLYLLNQLIESEAAALCIELDTNISRIPLRILELANQHDFPVIVFDREVPFVSITHDIHSVLINQQYEMIKKLDDYAQLLNKKLLSVNELQGILNILHKELEVPVIFRVKEQEPEIHPPLKRSEEMKIRKWYEAPIAEEQGYFTSAKVILFDQEYAELSIYRNDHPFSEYEILILDRTSTALAQFIMRDLYFDEKKRMEESKWIMSWLKGEQSNEQLEGYLRELKLDINGGVVCVFSDENDREPQDLTYFNLVARSIFEQQGFHGLTEKCGSGQLFILLDTRGRFDWKKRLKAALEKILQSHFLSHKENSVISVGKYQEEMMNISVSYKTAQESLLFRSKIDGGSRFYFFDDLHLYRLISIVNNNVNLSEMIEEYLHPLLLYDKENEGSLLLTLKVFLSCQGSKQETAKKLFIVRQTLYHRLRKIEELLGEDFMSPDKRLAIEFLLSAHDYLNPLKFVKKQAAK